MKKTLTIVIDFEESSVTCFQICKSEEIEESFGDFGPKESSDSETNWEVELSQSESVMLYSRLPTSVVTYNKKGIACIYCKQSLKYNIAKDEISAEDAYNAFHEIHDICKYALKITKILNHLLIYESN